MAGFKVTTEPTAEPLSLQEVKEYLRLEDASDERVVQPMITAARQFAEEHLGRSLMQQTITLYLDTAIDTENPLWEGMRTAPDLNYYKNYIVLPKSPVQSVTSVKTYNDSDTATTMAASKYYVDTSREPARIVLRTGESFPTALRVANAIEVIYVVGYASAYAIPEPIRLGMFQHIAHLYEHRGDMGEYLQAREIPAMIKMLYAPYRIHGGLGSSMLLSVG
jgi:hypothetical protein|tara:strand:+ start:159 stop:821 length:663 start_codon:yes stop_codon:yes gene_type:complete